MNMNMCTRCGKEPAKVGYQLGEKCLLYMREDLNPFTRSGRLLAHEVEKLEKEVSIKFSERVYASAAIKTIQVAGKNVPKWLIEISEESVRPELTLEEKLAVRAAALAANRVVHLQEEDREGHEGGSAGGPGDDLSWAKAQWETGPQFLAEKFRRALLDEEADKILAYAQKRENPRGFDYPDTVHPETGNSARAEIKYNTSALTKNEARLLLAAIRADEKGEPHKSCVIVRVYSDWTVKVYDEKGVSVNEAEYTIPWKCEHPGCDEVHEIPTGRYHYKVVWGPTIDELVAGNHYGTNHYETKSPFAAESVTSEWRKAFPPHLSTEDPFAVVAPYRKWQAAFPTHSLINCACGRKHSLNETAL